MCIDWSLQNLYKTVTNSLQGGLRKLHLHKNEYHTNQIKFVSEFNNIKHVVFANSSNAEYD